MSNFYCAVYRHDIEQYIKEHGKVSQVEIYQEFRKGKDIETFQLELDTIVDKTKKEYINAGGKFYIDFDGLVYTYIEEDLESSTAT